MTKQKINFQEVLGPEFFRETIGEIAKGIDQSRVVLVMSFPGSPAYRQWLYLVEDEEVQKRYLKNRYKFVRIDLEVLAELTVAEIERNLREELGCEGELEMGLRRREESSQLPVVLGLFGGERVLEEGKFEIIKWADVIRRLNLMRLVLFFEFNLLNETTLKVLSRVPTFQFRVVPMPLYDKQTAWRFAGFLEKEEGVELGEKLKRELVELSQGMLVLLKAMIWVVKDREMRQVHEILATVEMRLVLGEVWRGFGEKEREVMRRIGLGEKVSGVELAAELDYLMMMGIIEKKEGKWKIKVPLLEWYIYRSEGQGRDLVVNHEGKILLEGVEVEGVFSKREKRLLRYLIEYKGELVKREELGKFLWENGDYSDWALDAVVSRLRKKLAKIGLKDKLKTKRDRGIVYGG